MSFRTCCAGFGALWGGIKKLIRFETSGSRGLWPCWAVAVLGCRAVAGAARGVAGQGLGLGALG